MDRQNHIRVTQFQCQLEGGNSLSSVDSGGQFVVKNPYRSELACTVTAAWAAM